MSAQIKTTTLFVLGNLDALAILDEREETLLTEYKDAVASLLALDLAGLPVGTLTALRDAIDFDLDARPNKTNSPIGLSTNN